MDEKRINDPSRGGGTSGTGPPEASGRDDDGEAGERQRDRDETEEKVAGTGSSVARSGRASGEGGESTPNPPGGGDPGGMGGTVERAPHDRRPPGGDSPMPERGER